MKLKYVTAFIAAGALSLFGARLAADLIEDRSAVVVRSSLIDEGHDWTAVATNGLQIVLSGEAPDEATRFSVVSAVGRAVDADRIVDEMTVRPSARFAPPRFSIEMLRNGDGVSLIGLIPAESDREEIVASIESISASKEVTDMLESARYPAPEGWERAMDFALEALQELPRSKISVSARQVKVTAISDSPDDKRRIERLLTRKAPDDLPLVLDISAPRPVIAPFTLRLTLEDGVAKFDACSASNDASKARILAAAAEIGVEAGDCRIGLGVPSPRWPEAVEIAVSGLQEMGGGSLTFSDADVTLVALDSTAQGHFDRVVGDLNATLPEIFSLHAVLPEKVVVDGTGEDDSAVEFVATRSPEGLVQLRGRLTDERTEEIVGSFARAQFGAGDVYLATREDPDLPQNWPVRVLAALEALSTLEHGSVVVQSDYVEIRGTSGSRDSPDEISRILADKLGESENFDVTVRYDELLDETLNLPTPEECVQRINLVLATTKIVFEPSAAEITEANFSTMDQIAEIAAQCTRVQMEIGGHTDSQGREVMNEALSQQRADAVLAALMDRRVRTRNITAKGYGETIPIADNDTEEGREANRRIEFKLLTDAQLAATDEDPASEAAQELELPQINDDDTAETPDPAEDPNEQN